MHWIYPEAGFISILAEYLKWSAFQLEFQWTLAIYVQQRSTGTREPSTFFSFPTYQAPLQRDSSTIFPFFFLMQSTDRIGSRLLTRDLVFFTHLRQSIIVQILLRSNYHVIQFNDWHRIRIHHMGTLTRYQV